MATILANPNIDYTNPRENGYFHVPNCGFSGRSSLRVCAVLGMISAVLYISAGGSMLGHLSSARQTDNDDAGIPITSYDYPENKREVLTKLTIAIMVANVIQIISDGILFLLSLRDLKWRTSAVWGCCLFDRMLFITTFLCSVFVLSEAAAEAGTFLLVALLVGIVVRVYCCTLFRQAVKEIIREQTGAPYFYTFTPIILCFPVF